MIILIGSQKGGCGKSTLAVNLAVAFANQGGDVMLVDADRQSTAANWATIRTEERQTPEIFCVQRFDNIIDTTRDLARRYNKVIIDCAGRDSRELRTGMVAADILLVPFRPSQPDLDTLVDLVRIVEQAKDLNRRLQCYACLTMAPTNPVVNEVRESQQYLAEFNALKLLKTIVRDRKVYRDVMGEGLSVTETTNIKARSEIHFLAEEIMDTFEEDTW